MSTWHALVKKHNLTICLRPKHPQPLTAQELGLLTTKHGLLRSCVDASRDPDTGSTKIGLVTTQDYITVHVATIAIREPTRSSYEAEMLGIAIATLLPGTSTILCDNKGAIDHLQRMRMLGPQLQSRFSMTNQAQDASLTCLKGAHDFQWVKGHVPPPRTLEQQLNHTADRHAGYNTNVVLTRTRMATQTPGQYYRDTMLITRLNTLYDSNVQLWQRWGERLSLAVIHRKAVAFYYNPVTSTTTLHHTALDSLFAVRMRALFPSKHPALRRCRCGTYLTWDVKHVILECAHSAHTTTPTSFHSLLRGKYGNGWWNPSCMLTGTCHCGNPLSTYTCVHLAHCFAPSYASNRLPLHDWANYLHQRLEVCHPGNDRFDWRRHGDIRVEPPIH